MDSKKSMLDAALQEIAQIGGTGALFAGLPSKKALPQEQPSASLRLRRPARVRTRPEAPREKVAVKVVAKPGQVDAVKAKLSDLQGNVFSMGPQVILAEVPVDRLGALSELDGIARAEAPRQFFHRMDIAKGPISRANDALQEHPTLRGSGVVVGIVDSGIDWKHPDFLNADGTTRIETLIHGQEGDDAMTCLCDQYTEAQINAALSSGIGVPHGDPNGHGTHCASIAAGNGRALAAGTYVGVAPEATLMGARLDSLSDVNIIDSIRRIFAAAGDRPAVVNLSLGSHFGAHDGTSAIENVIARETGPGRIIVVAAGNEGTDRIHYTGTLVENEDLEVEFTIRDELQAMTVWIPRGDEVVALLEDPDGTMTPLSENGGELHTSQGAFKSWLEPDPVNGDTNLVLLVAAHYIGRRWKLRLRAGAVLSGEVHAWAETWEDPYAARTGIFMSETSPRYSLGMPGTEERAIVVGALTSRESILPGGAQLPGLCAGALAGFSSHGPTRTGVQRPDVAAPGEWIVAAMASDSAASESDDNANRRLSGGHYISFRGTSMATPFVTGVIALMLEREPGLTPEDIRLRLRATSQRDNDTGGVWNTGFGYGKVDVQALLNYGIL